MQMTKNQKFTWQCKNCQDFAIVHWPESIDKKAFLMNNAFFKNLKIQTGFALLGDKLFN